MYNNEIFCYISTNINYACDYIYISNRDESKKYSGNIKIRIQTKSINENIVNNNNEIQQVNKNIFIEEIARTYTKDIEKTTQKIIQKHEKAKQLQKQLNEISNEIHNLSNYCIDCVKYTNSVNFYI